MSVVVGQSDGNRSYRKDSNGILAVASYIFIKRYKEITSEPISGVHYNKYMTLLNRSLLEDNISIKLPHCWYRWGDEVVRYHMPQQITWNHEDSYYTVVDWSGTPPTYDSKDEIVKKIIDFVEEFIARYSTVEKYDLMKDEVYSEAPYEFQKKYKSLREISSILKGRSSFENQNENVIKPLFKDAMDVFPEYEFKKIIPEKNAFEEAFQMALRKGLNMKELADVVEDFWFYFCYFLRLDKNCNENVPSSTLKIWRDALPLEKKRYNYNLQDLIYRLVDDTHENPDVINDFLSQRRRRKSQEERALSYLDKIDFSDFDTEIQSLRGKSDFTSNCYRHMCPQ